MMASISSLPPKVAARVMVDEMTGCWEWSGSKTHNGYGSFTHEGKPYRAHRFSFEHFVGLIPAGIHVDHRCLNRCCLNPSHLRLATPKQNQENRKPSNCKTGFRNVYLIPSRSRPYQVQVMHDRRKYSGGYFSTAEEANEAAIALRNKLYTHNDADRHRE